MTVRAQMLIVIFGLLLLAFGFQGSRGLWEPDEGFYASAAAMMYRSGDLLVPRLNYEPFLDKPPLLYWGMVAGIHVLGWSEWGLRGFHALCFVGTSLAVVLLGGSLYRKREYGWYAGIIYATMVLPFAAANVITPDTVLALWVTAAWFCFWKSVEPGAHRAALWQVLMCAAFGLGFLTKGPAALVPGAALFCYLLLQRRMRRYFLTPWTVVGLAVFSAIGMTWYWYVAQSVPGAAAYFWDNQFWGRLISPRYDRFPGITGALVVFPPTLFLGSLPWGILGLGRALKQRKEILSLDWWRSLPQRPVALLLCCWFVIPLVIMTMASSKLPLYVLPLFPALALAMAPVVHDAFSSKSRASNGALSGRFLSLVGLWAFVLLSAKLAVAHYPTPRDSRSLWEDIRGYLPNKPYELISVEERLSGLYFYGVNNLERVTLRKNPYPFFVMPEDLNTEIQDIENSSYVHLLICKNEKRAAATGQLLRKADIDFSQLALPHDRILMTCEPTERRTSPASVRLAVLGDSGTGDSRQFSVASALHLLYGEKSFDDGVLLLGDNVYRSPHRPEDIAASLSHCFQRPFQALIRDGIPFFAVLGNHDYANAMAPVELGYPLFHMDGRRYYARQFGGGLVEVFFLDSTQLRRNDPEQVEWLQRALSESCSTWKVVALHHPLYSTAFEHPSDPFLVALLEPLFIRHGVSLVLSGHNHIYERLIPINGVHYLTVGSSGKLNRGFLRSDAPGRISGNDDTNVFLWLEFDQETCRFSAYDILLNEIDQGLISRETRGTESGPCVNSIPDQYCDNT